MRLNPPNSHADDYRKLLEVIIRIYDLCNCDVLFLGEFNLPEFLFFQGIKKGILIKICNQIGWISLTSINVTIIQTKLLEFRFYSSIGVLCNNSLKCSKRLKIFFREDDFSELFFKLLWIVTFWIWRCIEDIWRCKLRMWVETTRRRTIYPPWYNSNISKAISLLQINENLEMSERKLKLMT